MATVFYETYRRLCEKAGKSDNAIAAEIGLSNSTVTSWRQGALPRRPTIKKVADYFGISFEEMMGYTEKEKPPTPEGERELPHAKYREVLAEGGIRLLLDADAKVTQEQLDDILDFIKFKQQQYGR